MNNLLNRIVNKLTSREPKDRQQEDLARLKESSSPNAEKLSAAILDVQAERLSPEEKKWVSRIEAFRGELATQANRPVTFTDFGAGKPGQEYTAEQSARGVSVTRSVAEICAQGGLSSKWLLLLFKLTRHFKPLSCVELGTSLGMSAAYQGAALRLNGQGKLITLEGAENLTKIAEENWNTLEVADRVRGETGRFQDILPRVLQQASPIDYAFIDGHHDEEATVDYFNQFLPYLAGNAVLIFDDILYYEGMKRAWKRVVSHPKSLLAVDLGVVGVILTSESSAAKEYYTIHL